MSRKLYLLAGLSLAAGCSSTPEPKVPQSSVPAVSVEAPSGAFRSQDPRQVTIAVVGINDFHGSLLPKESKLKDGTRILSGGAPVLYSIIQRLNEEMEGKVLVIDAGDEWQGTLESNSVKGATVVDFFNRLGVKTAAIGNHEFDFGLPNLKERANSAHYPYVASNIREKKSHRRVRWPNVSASSSIEVGGIKFGIIGVTTQQTPGATRYENVKHLEFVNPAPVVRAEAARLRKKGASAVLVTAHAGTECRATKGLKDWRIHLPEAATPGCDEEQEISVLARKTGAGILDGIVAGHTHQIIHHFMNGVPVVQGEAYNQYFNIIYYTFDRETGRPIPGLTRIEGVVPICAEFFAGTRHCDVRRLAEGEVPARERAVFHGKEIIPDPAIEAWLAPIREGTEKYRKEVVGETVLPLTHYRDRESPFANLIADVLKEAGHADFALVNSGGVRTSLDAGPITYDGLFRALPFDNLLRVIELSGRDVKTLFEIALSGSHGIVGLSGLEVDLIPPEAKGEKRDLNRDGKTEGWEVNRIRKIRLAGGGAIEDSKIYRLATFDYLVSGGDDLAWFMGRVPSRAVSRKYSGFSRDLVADHLRRVKVVNTPEHPLVNPAAPRIRFVEEAGPR